MKRLIFSGILALACTSALVMANDKPTTCPAEDASCSSCKAPATQPSAQAKPVNKFCPVESDDEIDPKVTIVYEGKTIAFCCKDCIKDFNKDPAKYMAHLK